MLTLSRSLKQTFRVMTRKNHLIMNNTNEDHEKEYELNWLGKGVKGKYFAQ